MTQPRIQFALDFPQGHILFAEGGGSYFLPRDSMDAFQIWGERKELFGKNAISVAADRAAGTPAFSVVYEFSENGALTDARLVSGSATLRGRLADAETLNNLNGALAQNALNLWSRRDTQPERVYNAARFADGRLLIQMSSSSALYIGTPGQYEKVDAQLTIQGGGSKYYRTPDGGQINLPYGYGGPNGEIPTFKGEPMNYIPVNDNGNPAQFGLELAEGLKHLTPFCPEVQTPAQDKKPQGRKPQP